MSHVERDDCPLCGGRGEVTITPYDGSDGDADSYGCPMCIQAERDAEINELADTAATLREQVNALGANISLLHSNGEELAERVMQAEEQNETLLSELLTLYQGYVNLLESGRDKIIALGGDCDPVDVMERNDPWLISARKVLASAKGSAA